MNHRKAPLPASMKRHPAPKGICRWCDAPVMDGNNLPTKATWHPACVEAFKLIHWPAETRAAVYARDKGICSRCGVDSNAQQRAWRETSRLWYWLARRHYDDLVRVGKLSVSAWGECHTFANVDVERQMKASGMRTSGSAWQHDHIRPLVEANGDLSFWQLSNIDTKCTTCHLAKGREDIRRRKVVIVPSVQQEMALA